LLDNSTLSDFVQNPRLSAFIGGQKCVVRSIRLGRHKDNGPPMNTDERGFDSLTERVLGAVFEVSNTLGAGFLEKVYERALLRELGLRGIRAAAQVSFAVTYKGHTVGEYFADLLVEDVLVVELKCVERLANEPMAQCLNYLRASRRTVCLLVNFQKPQVQWKRIGDGFQVPEPREEPTLAG
jgi:GxxExxY protein